MISNELSTSVELPDGKVLFLTRDELCLSTNKNDDLDSISLCSHKEADTRIFVHTFSAASSGHKKILILANDSDIIVLGIRAFALSSSLDELWITYSSGKNLSYIAIHEVFRSMESSDALALPGFHSFTGCDTTSSFRGKGKKKAFLIWKSNPLYTTAFLELSTYTSKGPYFETIFGILQRFVCQLYGEDSNDVNECRLSMLVHKGASFDNMPPTMDALYLHTLRASHQSGNIWSYFNQATYNERDITEWGYRRNESGIPEPIYVTKPVISKSLPELVMCGCKTGHCGGNCKCSKYKQQCTNLCKCKRSCKR